MERRALARRLSLRRGRGAVRRAGQLAIEADVRAEAVRARRADDFAPSAQLGREAVAVGVRALRGVECESDSGGGDVCSIL